MFKDSEIDILYYDNDEACEGDPCQVRIENGEIIVDYEEEGKRVIYKGIEKGDGHFELKSQDVDGRASLHRFEGAKILEGYWLEDGCRGMWRIRLA